MTRLAEADINQAHNESVRLDTAAVAKFLAEVLGTRLVAILAASKDPKAVQSWIDGTRNPRPKVEQRMRTALQAVRLLQAAESEHVIRAWFIGHNPQLGDDTPAEALAADRLKDVLTSARAFVQTG